MKARKIFCALLTLVTIISGSVTKDVYADEPSFLSENTQIIEKSLEQSDINVIKVSKDKDTIIHNNGYAMESDYFENGKNEGNNLVAVKLEQTNYGYVETAYFANVEHISKSELNNIVSSDSPFKGVIKATAKSTIYKSYNWSFYSDGIRLATLTSNVSLSRKSSNATINGKKCSVWDVNSFTQLEKEHANRLNYQYTRLSVNTSNQTLLSYGPNKSSSKGNVSVGLDGGGVSGVSYSFDIGGFVVNDLSSLSNKYGRWSFTQNVGNQASLTTNPAIRTTNSSGNFVVELSHTANMTTKTDENINKGTGVVQIYCEDR